MKMSRAMSIAISIALSSYLTAAGNTHDQHRAMTFLDIIQMRSSRSPDISPDGKWFVYVLQIPDWKNNNKHSDIYLTPLSGGATRQMTFTVDKNERSPKWYKDSSFFAFISDRSEGKSQVFFMSLNGGDVRQVTDEKYGVDNYEWSSDGKYLSYLSGKPNDRQIWLMPGKGGKAKKLTNHATSISTYRWSPDSEKIYFVAPKTVDVLEQKRKEGGFGVRIRDQVSQPSYLWEIDVHTGDVRQRSKEFGYSIYWPEISPDGKKICFAGSSIKRHTTPHESEVFLMDLDTGNISQVTDNHIWEVYLSFSPDSNSFAFSVADDGEDLMDAWKICVTPSKGGSVKKLLRDFDYDPQEPFWSDDSKLIYFSAQVGVNKQLFSVCIDDGKIEQKTHFGGEAYFTKDNDSGKCYIWYSDPKTPGDYYYSEPEDFGDRENWIKLTDTNPQLRDVSLGEYETVRWTSRDGRIVEGLLVKPVDYSENVRFPLIVQLHGGPLSTSSQCFSASWWEYVHIYAASGYMVFQPNYRGSKGYGKEFKKAIAKDYFGLSFDDIMTGVDYLVESKIVDPDRMGIMGWSAGGDFSNWALVSTDRFKAVSTGAGTVFSYGWTYWAAVENPIDRIHDAKTPTLIHFGENDYKHHGGLLYNELKKLGVPTEYIVYPSTGHQITNMRYQMVKMQAEFGWFEKWIKGKETWIDWESMLETLE